jgi:glycine betaine/proline transport system substrate-binding protein
LRAGREEEIKIRWRKMGMKLGKFSKLTMLAGLTAMFALVLAGCGGDDAPKPKLIFGDLNWDSAQIQNAIARAIAERGYDYETDAVPGGTIPLMQALTAGDTNINMELWLPNQADAWAEAYKSGDLQIIGNSLEDNWQSSYIIPQYTADANPGLRKVSDLPDYVDLFKTTATGDKGRNIGCIPGWECEVINEKKLVAYGLDDTYELVNPGSMAALNAEVLDAFTKKEDILFYYWGPTALANKIDSELGGYLLLEEPAHSKECEAADPAWGCAYPLAEVLVVMRTDLVEAAPDIAEFFGKWDFNAKNQVSAENYMSDSGGTYAETAIWFLQNTKDWKTWVTADALSKIEKSF